MRTYQTAEVAAAIGVHPNTVRLYEKWGLISPPVRRPNGYRVFTDLHLAQFQLARLAFQVEVLQNGLRKKAVSVVKASAAGDFDAALTLAEGYLAKLRREQANAEEAIAVANQLLAGQPEKSTRLWRRGEATALLGISADTLRNWELNGLLRVKRRQNGYRVYTGEDLRRLKIIRSLRCANYSLEAILGMLCRLSQNPGTDIRQALDTPREDAEIVAVCDRLISSLTAAEENAEQMIRQLRGMKAAFA